MLSGLQSEPVYRLKNVWALVPKSVVSFFPLKHKFYGISCVIFSEKVKEFNDLSRIFSEDDNYNGARALLEKEGTAKVVNITEITKEKQNKRQFRHRRSKSEMVFLNYFKIFVKNCDYFVFQCDIQGTVPYLGTFLTDLTMIDSAHQDYVESKFLCLLGLSANLVIVRV